MAVVSQPNDMELAVRTALETMVRNMVVARIEEARKEMSEAIPEITSAVMISTFGAVNFLKDERQLKIIVELKNANPNKA